VNQQERKAAMRAAELALRQAAKMAQKHRPLGSFVFTTPTEALLYSIANSNLALLDVLVELLGATEQEDQ